MKVDIKNKIRENFLPFSKPTIGTEEIEEVVDSLRSGWITTGPKTEKFEKLISDYLGVEEALCVNSATAGLHLVLIALGLKPGDEVITPSMTWPSAVNMIEIMGARPLFVDIDRETMQIKPGEVEKNINQRTKAVIPVHFAGAPCDLDKIKNILKGKNIPLLEDAAHAIGTEYKGKRIGRDSEFAVFSFHPIKNITTGEGGAIVAKDKKALERMRLLKFHGVSKDAWKRYSKGGKFKYEVIEPGMKYNMLDLQAALGIRQLEKLDNFIEKRIHLAKRYNEKFEEMKEIASLKDVPYAHRHAWHLYIVKLDIDAIGISRDEFMENLQKLNIGTGLHYTPIHLHRFYREKYGYKRGSLPETEYCGERIISLPLYPLMTESDQDDVIEAIRKALKK